MHSRTDNPRRGARLIAAATAAASLVIGVLAFAAPAQAAPGDVLISDAVLEWSVSNEAGSGAFFGGCNFLSAGTAGNTGSSRLWTEADGFFQATDGNASIVKPNAAGELVPATWANKCQTPSGANVSPSSTTSNSGIRVQLSEGEGTIFTDGSGEIQWDGSFTVVFYGGLTYWTVADPILTWDANGTERTLTGTASGYGTSMEDMTQWVPIAPQEITLADLTNLRIPGGVGPLTADAKYAGVEVTTTGTAQTRTGANWGSFPQSWVDFNNLTGQSSYWYSSGGSRDAAKPANPIKVTFQTSEEPVEPEPEPEPGAGDITVEVPEAVEEPSGSFGWAWATESAVDLGTATASGANFAASGALNDVVVTDTRAGGTSPYSWSISGQVGEFASAAGSFSAGFLGWAPKVVSGTATAGAAVTSTQLGGTGLGAASVLASSNAASSATVGADLSLVIPGTTAAGDYKTTLTLTAVQ